MATSSIPLGRLIVDSKSASVSLPASDSATVTVNMAKTGYKFLGVVGINNTGTGATLGYVVSFYKSADNTATVTIRNTTSTARSYTCYVYGLYCKA